MSDEKQWSMLVKARDGAYRVAVDDGAFERLAHTQSPKRHVLIDARVAELYDDELRLNNVIVIRATEEAKSIGRMGWYAKMLLNAGIRRDHEIIAIGGGVVQDIACFLAGTLLRGVLWTYYPTTLLAQADSCIGSKSSINVGRFKNAMGTFTPPRAVWIVPHVLDTLSDVDMRSGVGEMLKVNAVTGASWFDAIAADYDKLFTDQATLTGWIQCSLVLKMMRVEADEFDRGVRRLLNYGHTFGHAIESVTGYRVPHGIAISIGMDMANFVASRTVGNDGDAYERMHRTLAANYAGFDNLDISISRLIEAMASDKKNLGGLISLIVPGSDGQTRETHYSPEALFSTLIGYSTRAIEKGSVCV